jgi:IS30 family transposase
LERADGRVQRLSTKPQIARKLLVGNTLCVKVRQGLVSGLSPEQVAGLLWRMDEPLNLCHETIYQAIYVIPKGELRTEVIALLRQGYNKSIRTWGSDRHGLIPSMTSIDLRPADIQERLVPDHLEGDHITGSSSRSQGAPW